MMARYTLGRRDRHRADRRARPRGQRVHRARPGPGRDWPRAWWWWPPATSRPWCASQAASTATAIAEYFRDQGKDVLLLMDSLTRFALAQREIGLAAGEPPTTRGYPPSVFALLPKLVERAGRSPRGSITAFYTRAGRGRRPQRADQRRRPRAAGRPHLALARAWPRRGHYPAIDVLESLSRLMPDVTDAEHRRAAVAVRELLAAYRDHEDLISIGRLPPRQQPHGRLRPSTCKTRFTTTCVKPSISPAREDARNGLVQLHQQAQRRLRGEAVEAA